MGTHRQITWNGYPHASMAQVADSLGLNRMTFKRYYDMGMRSNADLETYRNRKCDICGEALPEKATKYCSVKCRSKAQRLREAQWLQEFKREKR